MANGIASSAQRNRPTLHPYRPLNPFAASVALNIWGRRVTHPIRTFDEIDPLRVLSDPRAGYLGHPTATAGPHSAPPPATILEFTGRRNPYTVQQPPGSNYNHVVIPRLREYLWVFFADVLPRQIYLLCLLHLPSLYYDRTSRVFQSAGLTLEEIKDMAIKSMAEDHQAFQNKMLGAGYYYNPQVPNLSPVYHRLKTAWESLIDKLIMEWQTLNIISALLVPGVLTMFQIEGAADDPITRYIAFWSLLCALISVLHGCIFLVRFSNMRKPHKAAEWALETQKHQNIFWNVWVMMAMPVLWLAWSILAFITCIMLFLWRFSTGLPMNFTFTTGPHMELGFRIFICTVLGIGILYIILTAITLMRYGSQMDEAWTRRIEAFITFFDPQPPFQQLRFGRGLPNIGNPTYHLPVRMSAPPVQPPPQPQFTQGSRRFSPVPTSPPRAPSPRIMHPAPRPWSPQIVQAAPLSPSTPDPERYIPRPTLSPRPWSPQIVQEAPRPRPVPEFHQLLPVRPRPRSPLRPQVVQEAPQSPRVRQLHQPPPAPERLQSRSPSPPRPRITPSQSPEFFSSRRWHHSPSIYSPEDPLLPHHREPQHQALQDDPLSPRSRRHASSSDTSLPSLHRQDTPPHIQRSSTSLLGEESWAIGSNDGRRDRSRHGPSPDTPSSPIVPPSESDAPEATPRRASVPLIQRATAESVPSEPEVVPTSAIRDITDSPPEIPTQ